MGIGNRLQFMLRTLKIVALQQADGFTRFIKVKLVEQYNTRANFLQNRCNIL